MKILSKILSLGLALIMAMNAVVPIWAINEDWDPPMGIPRPEFGVTNSVDMYLPEHGITYTFTDGRGTILYPVDASGKPYTHYIDKATGTDTGRPYGTHTAPRATWPANVDVGSVVSVAGYGLVNPYSFNNSAPGNKMGIQGPGTADRPIFLRGLTTNRTEMPYINRSEFTPNGNYLIVENFGFYMCNASGRAGLKGAPISHLVFRYCHAVGDGANGGPSSAFGMSGSSAANYTEYGLVIFNEISHYGNWAGTIESDNLATVFGEFSYNMWMIDNEVHHMGGDAVRSGKDLSSLAGDPDCDFHYIGRNHFHHNRENGVDVKKAGKVVISENVMHDFAISGTSSGTALAIHYYPRSVWVLNNRFYNAPRMIASTSSAGYEVNIIGNTFSNATEYAMYPDRGGGTYRIYNNTIINSAAGIIANDFSANHTLIVKGNILLNISGDYLDVSSSYTPFADYTHNLLYEGGTSTPIIWGGSGTFNTVAAWIAGTTAGDFSLSEDPLMNDDMTLQELSQAREAGYDYSSLDVSFKALFGYDLTILKDINGTTRGADGFFDMGAFEYIEEFSPKSSAGGTVSIGGNTKF